MPSDPFNPPSLQQAIEEAGREEVAARAGLGKAHKQEGKVQDGSCNGNGLAVMEEDGQEMPASAIQLAEQGAWPLSLPLSLSLSLSLSHFFLSLCLNLSICIDVFYQL